MNKIEKPLGRAAMKRHRKLGEKRKYLFYLLQRQTVTVAFVSHRFFAQFSAILIQFTLQNYSNSSFSIPDNFVVKKTAFHIATFKLRLVE